MQKILVGLSGGVDSAVCAYLLKLAGYEVIGATLRTWVNECGEDSRCCEIDDAREIADFLGIPYYVKNCMAEFKEKVTEPFIFEYLNGRTPNPCVGCNRTVKWAKMLEMADALGADLVATGHYATIVRKENGRLTVKQSPFAAKDQSYMLYRLTQEQLARTIMPLGPLTKEEVRNIAGKAGIPVAETSSRTETTRATSTARAHGRSRRRETLWTPRAGSWGDTRESPTTRSDSGRASALPWVFRCS